MNIHGRSALLLALAIALTPQSAVAQPATSLELWVEVGGDGALGGLWQEMLGKRMSREQAAAVVEQRRPLSDGQRAWVDAIRARLRYWTDRIPALTAPFEPIPLPESVRIVLGNRGGDAAFTHDASTLGFDLSRLADEYGKADGDESAESLDRLFDHQFSQALVRTWLAQHPQPAATPFELALLEMWAEGLGNYHSMSARWRASAGAYSRPARGALARLEPTLVERLTALACATPEQAAPLVADLSRGAFDRKWGALPVALWLDAEASATPDALRRFVQEGVSGLVSLAERRLPAPLAAGFQAARARSQACSG